MFPRTTEQVSTDISVRGNIISLLKSNLLVDLPFYKGKVDVHAYKNITYTKIIVQQGMYLIAVIVRSTPTLCSIKCFPPTISVLMIFVSVNLWPKKGQPGI